MADATKPPTETTTTAPTSAAATDTSDDNQEWVSVVVDDFEDGGIVYYVDQNNIVYDTEDIYFGVKPARVIGRRVDGKFIPIKSKASASPVSTSSTNSTT